MGAEEKRMNLGSPAEVWAQYSDCLCAECKAKMLRLGAAIKARTDAGKKLRVTDTLRVLNAFCPDCYQRLAVAVHQRHKQGGMKNG